MAFHSAVAGERPTAAQWNDWLFRRAIADCTSSTRPTSPVEGQPIYETDTDKVLIYSGSEWIEIASLGWGSYSPTWTTAGTAPVLGNGVTSGYYKREGGRGTVWARLDAGSTSTFGTGGMRLSLPSGWSAVTGDSGAGFLIGAGAVYYPILAYVSAGTTIDLYAPSSATDTRLSPVSGTVPFSWTSTSIAILGPITVHLSS